MSLPGQLVVNQAGAANYSIPIAVPPGTAGVVPSLSLDYSSQGANGLLGVGWTLSGLPSIGRCPRTVAQDGVAGAVNYDGNDRFCLNGQRLILVGASAGGANSQQYYTEVDTFSEIVAHGDAASGPDWFEVHTKSGQVMEFGSTADSQILAQGKTAVRVWAVNKVSDSKTNYFTVSYTNDATNGQYYPNRIDYTGNTAASVSAYNSVQFVYAARPDVVPHYQAGSLSQTTVRLTDVKTYAASALVADYHLAYVQSSSSGSSQVSAIGMCGADGNCVPSTAFAWTSGGTGTFSVSSSSLGCCVFGSPVAANWLVVSGDFDGDGKSDFAMIGGTSGPTSVFVSASNGDGSFATTSTQLGCCVFGPLTPNPLAAVQTGRRGIATTTTTSANWFVFVGDFDGDGKSDLAFVGGADPQTQASQVFVFTSNGDGTFAAHASTLGCCAFGLPPASSYDLVVGDFNADGRTDFAMIGGPNQANLFVFTSNGDGTFGTTSTILACCVFGNPPRTNWDFVTGDFNGDGKTDFAMLGGTAKSATQEFVFLSNGDGTFAQQFTTLSGDAFGLPPRNSWDFVIGDFNGDGKTDFAMLGGVATSATQQFVFTSRGDGTFAQQFTTLSGDLFGLPTRNNWDYVIGDFNGDGKTDFAMIGGVVSSATQQFVFTSNGDGTFAQNFTTIGCCVFGAPPRNNWAIVNGDFNGDGKTDFALLGGAGATSVFTSLANGNATDLVTAVSTGLSGGAAINVSYDPATKSSVYTKGNAASYPQRDFQAPVYLASRVDRANGLGGSYSTAYSYAGAKLDLSGRGLLGFSQMTVKDLQSGITDTTTYHQDFPYVGLPASRKRSLGAQTISQSTNTYQFSNWPGTTTIDRFSAPYQVSLKQSVSSGADLDGSALPTMTTTNQYDAFGNPTQVVVSTSDGFSKTTTSTYTNDTINWHLGQLTRSGVTGVAP
ncbi:MAG TPA: FG-GAP-like repeat-containing protein [Bradyrhizobium sp.]|nr:FG-GAP-like repeat-containing protein [Bradyrhizobium sp.]